MINFLTENLGTVIVGLAVAGAAAAIIVKITGDAKNGKCAGCGGCKGHCRYESPRGSK